MEDTLRRASAEQARHGFTWRVAACIALLVAAVFVWYTGRILFLAFDGSLSAIFLDYLAGKLSQATGMRRGAMVTNAVYGLAGLAVIAVLGIYLGANPSFYKRGILKLVPKSCDGRAADVLGEVAYTLRWWATGHLMPWAYWAWRRSWDSSCFTCTWLLPWDYSPHS